MNKRPLSVTLVSILFILAGIVGIIYHAPELKQFISHPETILIFVIRLLAILGGAFALRAANWARWLLVVWISYHVVISLFHPLSELVVHLIFLALVIVALFNAKAKIYFRAKV